MRNYADTLLILLTNRYKMKNKFIILALLPFFIAGCNFQEGDSQKGDPVGDNSTDNLAVNHPKPASTTATIHLAMDGITYAIENPKTLNPDLPTVGILMYDKVLQTEITAPIDVFAKSDEDGVPLFNVITIAENYEMLTTEEGLKMFPDYIFANSPQLDIIIVPSTFEMSGQLKNKNLTEFIIAQNNHTQYTVSNCGGATLIGETGIADGKKIVTWVGGGKDLQQNYPDLVVQDDSEISFVEDGKFLSSNGNLATYISSLELLEKLTNKKHREFVEARLYLKRLQQWK